MPSFQQCLDADPEQLKALGAAVKQAVMQLRQLGVDYGRTVLDLSPTWEGDDYLGLIDWAQHVAAFIGRSDVAWIACAATMDGTGDRMARTVEALKTVKREAEDAGYRVLPDASVALGPDQLAAVAAAGAGAPALLAAYRASAFARSQALAALYAETVAQDVIGYAAIRTALVLDEQQAYHDAPYGESWDRPPGPFEQASSAELERIAARVRGALEAAGFPLFDRLVTRDIASAYVEIDHYDGGRGVYVSWEAPSAADKAADFGSIDAYSQSQYSMERLQEALRAAGIDAEETDPDGQPYTLEITSVAEESANP